MIYQIKRSSKFKKDYKLALKRNLDVSKLEKVIRLLANGEILPKEYLDHSLVGNFAGCRECHIQSDWLLVYRYDKNTLILGLQRLGTHSDLF